MAPLSLLVAGGSLLLGCDSSNRAEVHGTIMLDGQPLPSGMINFLPADGNGPSAGATIIDGRYEIHSAKGVTPGSNQVMINSLQKTGRTIQSLDQVDEELAEAVPPEYNEETTLLRDVEPGSNELNFDLKGRIRIESLR